MQIIGPFLRKRPSTSTTTQPYAWCYLYISAYGDVVAIEWIGY